MKQLGQRRQKRGGRLRARLLRLRRSTLSVLGLRTRPYPLPSAPSTTAHHSEPSLYSVPRPAEEAAYSAECVTRTRTTQRCELPSSCPRNCPSRTFARSRLRSHRRGSSIAHLCHTDRLCDLGDLRWGLHVCLPRVLWWCRCRYRRRTLLRRPRSWGLARLSLLNVPTCSVLCRRRRHQAEAGAAAPTVAAHRSPRPLQMKNAVAPIVYTIVCGDVLSRSHSACHFAANIVVRVP